MLDAASIMTRKVVTAHPSDTVARVARLLADNSISAVPVCDDSGAVLGMVSEGDLMRPFVNTNVKRRAWWLTLLADGTELAPEFVDYVRLDRHEVGDLMTRPVIAATDTASVTELAEQMVTHRIKRVPIVRDGKLIGIVSRADVIRAIAQSLDAVVEPV
ncbi:MAG TPA: CBS domain-containing protein [Acetobacteraceae bacterium]|jgi:CBS domain-containing protein|nr:CBS domain-containing protein [Acetobacteraceae bacterium]